jgi:hypothetical protein
MRTIQYIEPDGTRWAVPWGWGSVQVRTVPKTWRCPSCDGKAHSELVLAEDTTRCPSCAMERSRPSWVRYEDHISDLPAERHDEDARQLSLLGVPDRDGQRSHAPSHA